MKYFIVTIGALVIMYIMFAITAPKTEKTECLQWKVDSRMYPNYYLADWQKEQCKHYSIEIK